MQFSIIYHLLHVITLIMSLLPLRVGQFLGKMLGAAVFLCPMSRKKLALSNIAQSFRGMGEGNAKNLVRRVFLHFGQFIFEIPYMLRLNRENLHNYAVFDNEENLLNAVRKGKGVLFLTAHFGNWELLFAAIAVRFGSCALVVRPPDFLPVATVMSDLRSRLGVESINKRRAMRRLLTLLRANQPVGIMLDQNVDWYEGAFVDFFGRLACTNKGLAQMALKTEASVVPVFAVRQRDGRYRIIFEKEVGLLRTGDKTRDVEGNTALFAKITETYVRKYPDHWLWFHNRWKTRPYSPLPKDFYSHR